MWKKLGILVFLSVLLGEPKFQSEEGDSGIHHNPNLLGPSECGRSCSISGFLCHWRMLAEGTPSNHALPWSRAYLNVFHMWDMWRMWNNQWKPWFKSWSRTFDSHHTSSKFRKNKKYISEIRKKAGRFERRWGWLVDRENRRIPSLFSVKRCKESCSHIAFLT